MGVGGPGPSSRLSYMFWVGSGPETQQVGPGHIDKRLHLEFAIIKYSSSTNRCILACVDGCLTGFIWYWFVL